MHQILDVTIQAATGAKAQAAPLEQFLRPGAATPSGEPPAKPRTMRDWMRALGAFTAGVPLPPDRTTTEVS